MTYPNYVGGKTPVTAADLNAMLEQQRRNAMVNVAPPFKVWRDSRGVTLRLKTTGGAGGTLGQTPVQITGTGTDRFGQPQYTAVPVVLNSDGTINVGSGSITVKELNNNPNVPLMSYQWPDPGNVFDFSLASAADPLGYPSDYSVNTPVPPPFGSQQQLGPACFPTRLVLTLSNLFGCAAVAGTQIQLDFGQFQTPGPYLEPLYNTIPFLVLSGYYGSPNKDIASIVTVQDFNDALMSKSGVVAWYGGMARPDNSTISACMMYYPGAADANSRASNLPVPGAVDFDSFDRLALQLWLFYTSPQGQQVVAGPATCDSAYFPSVGAPYNGMQTGTILTATGTPTAVIGVNGMFAASFVLGWNSGGPCVGNVVALVQGVFDPTQFVGPTWTPQDILGPNKNLLCQDGGFGYESNATVSRM